MDAFSIYIQLENHYQGQWQRTQHAAVECDTIIMRLTSSDLANRYSTASQSLRNLQRLETLHIEVNL